MKGVILVNSAMLNMMESSKTEDSIRLEKFSKKFFTFESKCITMNL